MQQIFFEFFHTPFYLRLSSLQLLIKKGGGYGPLKP